MTVDPHTYMELHMRGGRRELPKVTLAEFLGAYQRFRMHHHTSTLSCPGCGTNLMTVGIDQLAYIFDICECRDTPADFDHLIEQMWHLKCLQPASFPLSIRNLLKDALYALDRYKAPIAKHNASTIRAVLNNANRSTPQDGGHSDPTTKEEQWKSSPPKPASPPTK